LVLIYPPTYPDVAPEISFETIDEESGELTEEEMETVLGQLNTTVRLGLGSESEVVLLLILITGGRVFRDGNEFHASDGV